VRRREFIVGLGATAASPLVARTQQADRMRRIGVLLNFDENDSEAQAHLSTFTEGLAELGWTDGRNIRMAFVGAPATLTECGCTRKSWSTCNPT
jgi:putative tryptophan/tyrosine transport system substrate-binding protein